MLRAIFSLQTPEGSGSKEKQKDGERQCGVITCALSRRLYAANSIMVDHINGLAKKHAHLHDDGRKQIPKHDCEAFANRIKRLHARQKILSGLLWQSVGESFPQSAINSVGIRDGWMLVDREGKWNDHIPFINKPNSIADNYLNRVMKIICGDSVSSARVIAGEGFGPVTAGEEVVGCLDDEKVRRIWMILSDIRSEVTKELPTGLTDDNFREVFGTLTINEIDRLRLLLARCDKLVEITTALFWCGVRDTVPAASDIPDIGIRQGWKVVKCVPEEDYGGVRMVMTPMGPAISVPRTLVESLMRLGQ